MLRMYVYVYIYIVECVGFFICHFCKIQKLFLAQVETICEILETSCEILETICEILETMCEILETIC